MSTQHGRVEHGGGRVRFVRPARPGARVLVVSGSFGAGHDRAADQVQARLLAAGYRVDRADFVDLLPGGVGRALRFTYHAQLRTAPNTWGWLLSAAEDSAVGSSLIRICALAAQRLLARITPDIVAVVSTYPLASQTLGCLRLSGRLSVPALTFLTDMSVHPMWVARGIDAHLALHEVPAGQARTHGAKNVYVCGPLVPDTMRPASCAADRQAARARLGLPASDRLALVVTGSWGVGNALATAQEIAATGVAIPVVACGQNAGLRRRVERSGVGIALGWTSDMPTLYRAVDVVVQSGGGMSSLEALACGLPVVSYRVLPGHGETNAAALDEAGWAAWVASGPGELARALLAAAPTGWRPVVGDPPMVTSPTIARMVTAISARPAQWPLRQRSAPLRAAVGVPA